VDINIVIDYPQLLSQNSTISQFYGPRHGTLVFVALVSCSFLVLTVSTAISFLWLL
jgi:hypothetical protein